MPRNLSISLARKSGSISRFYAFVNGVVWINSEGKKPSKKKNVDDGDLRIKLETWGQGNAKYTATIKLKSESGVELEKKELPFTLEGGLHEQTISL